MRVINYQLVETVNVTDLNSTINNMIKEGWQPLGAATQTGGAIGDSSYYYNQTMVIYEEGQE